MHQFNWPDCVNKLRPSLTETLGKERGLGPITFEKCRDRSWLGCCYVEKWRQDCIAFPVCDLNGTAFRAHCRSPQRNGDGKWTWVYEPYGDQRPIYPLVFGKLETAQRIYLFESQWDGIALTSTLNLWDELDSGFVAVVATRGAQYTEHLKFLSWPKGASVYAFPQTDEAGQNWLKAALPIISGCYVVEIPAGLNGIKDLNDWIRDGKATVHDIEGGIDHSIFRHPQARQQNGDQQSDNQKKTQAEQDAEREAAFSASVVKGAQLLAINIPPKKIIIDDWCKEGDLGFVFAYRGTGKTWLILQLCIAIADAGKCGPWQVQDKWPVLYVDGEMSHNDDKERISGLQPEIPENLHLLNHEVVFHRHQLVLNLGNRTDQEIITKICLQKGIKVLVLENLGCLFSGVGENDADEWEKILPWLLTLRRHAISVIIVHHSGHDSTRMRGTVKREDSAAWVLRLDDQRGDYTEPGARFISRFKKLRGQKPAPDYEWRFEPLA